MVPAVPDHLDRLGATITLDGADSRVRSAHDNVIFPTVAPDELRGELNAAIARVHQHFSRNVRAAGLAMEEHRILEVSLSVVLDTLYCFNIWRHNEGRRKTEPLVIGDQDLSSPQAYDRCRAYCRRLYGQAYAPFAAALTGLSIDEFSAFERGRDEFQGRR